MYEVLLGFFLAFIAWIVVFCTLVYVFVGIYEWLGRTDGSDED